MKKIIPLLLFSLSLFFLGGCGHQPEPLPLININADDVAIHGFDPVAYFTDQQPVVGSPEVTFQWQDATWRFASKEHRDLFAADPEKYAPQFGGYCAYAVSRNTTADIDPESWAVVRGKLYLNLNPDVQKLWLKDRDAYIDQAVANWPGVVWR